jgi:hypothetical protein
MRQMNILFNFLPHGVPAMEALRVAVTFIAFCLEYFSDDIFLCIYVMLLIHMRSWEK